MHRRAVIRIGLGLAIVVAIGVVGFVAVRGLGPALAGPAPHAAPDTDAASVADDARAPAKLAGDPDTAHASSPAPDPSLANLSHVAPSGDSAAASTATERTATADSGRRSAGSERRELTSAELDRARPEVVRETLERAIAAAQAERGLVVPAELALVAAEQGSVRVVFATVLEQSSEALAEALGTDGRDDSVADLRVFSLLGHAAATLSAGALHNLIRETQTLQIELDATHAPSLLESVPLIGGDLAHQAGWDGDGIAVAVIDTGVDRTHPMYASRLIEEACFSANHNCPNGQGQMLGAGAAVPCTLAGCDHGTHITGIAVGDAFNNNGLVGVAPHAKLIAINVFSNVNGSASAYTSDILAAMQHVLALTPLYAIASINLSLGGNTYTTTASCQQASPSTVSAIATLRNARIATVAAAGNDGLTNAISTPACLPQVLSVGSVGDSDVPSSFSNSADFLTLLAPGESIVSAAIGGGTRSGTGTSMATPHVSGAIAVIREAAPNATVDAIENALVLTGKPITDSRNGITTPRLRIDQAIAMLQSGGSNPPAAGGGGGGGATSGGGGGGGCGLVGLEPFLVLGLVRLGRRARHRASA